MKNIALVLALALGAWAQTAPITIRAGTVLDGKGGTLRDVDIVVQGSKIVSIGKAGKGAATYDLSRLTLMPGWIDTHTHIGWHFNREGRADMRAEGPDEFALRAAANTWATLLGGFTTVQSLGADTDKNLRDVINEGLLPGPRILTSLNALNERSGTPEEIRAKVKKLKAQGADLVKLFATKSIRDGGDQTM